MWRQSYTLQKKTLITRPRINNRNQRTLPHKDTAIPINTMGKKLQKGGKK